MTRSLALVLFAVSVTAVWVLALIPAPDLVLASGPLRHMLAFMALPLMSAIAWPSIGAGVQFGCYLMLAAVIELAQAVAGTGREASAEDWLIGTASAAITLILLDLVRNRSRAAGASA